MRLVVTIILMGWLIAGARAAPTATVPTFHSAAAARAWGERAERAGRFPLAGQAFLRESELRRAIGDPQGAELERRRAHRLLTDLALATPAPVGSTGALARLEPTAGCYLGALDQTPDGQLGNADDFANRVGRPIAVAFNYHTYGRPFPREWARQQARAGRAIQIAWEPNQGLGAVQDDDYLNSWARDAAGCGTGVFLRFAGEMNGGWTVWGRDPAAYRRAFRLVHTVIARYAPNVALVWAPNAVPITNVDAYYPGDYAVDWVGLSLYLVRYYDDNLTRPGYQDHPDFYIDPFYKKYAARKPLCLVECGVSRRSRVEGTDADPYAAARIADLFSALRVRYPRLKMACWFDRNNLTGATPERRLNDYSLPPGSLAMAAFQSAAADPYFLPHFGDLPTVRYRRVMGSLPLAYRGMIFASVSTYTLNPTLEITRDGHATRITRPFLFTPPPGHGPLTVRVLDMQGRAAATLRLAMP